jgi:hypothetical protein
MKKFLSLLAVTLLGAASIASAQLKMPHPTQPGMSMESAVRLLITNDLMIDRSINRWLRRNYPGWDAQPYDIREFGDERCAVVNISTQNEPDRKIYFRIMQHQKEEDDLPPLL